jgi:hypothetical protein
LARNKNKIKIKNIRASFFSSVGYLLTLLDVKSGDFFFKIRKNLGHKKTPQKNSILPFLEKKTLT